MSSSNHESNPNTFMNRRSWVFQNGAGAEYISRDGPRWKCEHCEKTYKAAPDSGTKHMSEHLEQQHGLTKPTAPGLQRPRRRARKAPIREDTPSPPSSPTVAASAQRPMASSASTAPAQTTRATNMGVIQNINLKQEQYYARVELVVARFIEPLLERLDELEQAVEHLEAEVKVGQKNERGLKNELEIERENSRTVQEAFEKNVKDLKNVVDAQKRNSSALNAVAQDKVRDEVETERLISRAVTEALNRATNEARKQQKKWAARMAAKPETTCTTEPLWLYCCHLAHNHEVLDEVVENPDVQQGALKQEVIQQDVGEDESNIPWCAREWNLRASEAVGVACAHL